MQALDDPKSSAEGEYDGVPVIDFECMKYDEEKIRAACREWGLFRLVNHGIPQSLLSQLLERTKKLFSMSFEAKQAAFTATMSYFWGTPAVSPSGAALASGTSRFHWMEGFNVPLTRVSQLHYEDPTFESFRCMVEEYGKHQGRVAKAIYQAVSRKQKFGALLPAPCEYFSQDTGILRLYRYPSCCLDDEEEERWGIGVHTDSSLLSILHQDLVGGLQVYNCHRWINVKPIPNTLIVNIGDMMQAISDDQYVSAKHRVKVNKGNERISIGYFVFPKDDVVIQSSHYKPFTYADFRAQVHTDLKTVGSKIGLHNFKHCDSD